MPPDAGDGALDSESHYSLVSRPQSQSELSMMQLARVDRQVQTLEDASRMLEKIQRRREEYN